MKRTSILSRLALGTAFVSSTLVGCSQESIKEGNAPAIEQATLSYALNPGCGNGVLEPELGEQCDDGNTAGGDGCDSQCRIEPGHTCFGDRPSVCTLPDYGDAPASYGLASHARSIYSISPFVGRGFWTTFPLNHSKNNATGQGIKIAGEPGTTGGVYDAKGNLIEAYTIPSDGVSSVRLATWEYEVNEAKTVTSKGVRVYADELVRVIATNEGVASTDSWAVWSTEALGLEYILLDASSSVSSNRQLVVVGTEPGTKVVIKDVSGKEMAQVTLGEGDAYRYPTPDPIVGWTVSGSKPIAVIAGTECTKDVGHYCDMTAEQIAPVNLWSREYVAAPGYANGSMTAKANHVVVASQDNTNVSVTDSAGKVESFALNARESRMFANGVTTQLGYFISADKPIGVVSNLGDPKFDYDPTLVTWPPLDGYVSEAKMPTSGMTTEYQHFLTIITRTSATGYIRVNSLEVPEDSWHAISTTGYSYARHSVDPGDNLVQGLNGVKFAAVALGGGTTPVSYGYSSPYDIGLIGGSTTCYLGDVPPDYEEPFAGSPACDQDDNTGINDEDAVSGTLVFKLHEPTVSLDIPCHDEYFGFGVNAKVHGFLDFNRNGTFDAGEHAEATCVGSTATSSGTASLTWSNPGWTDHGDSVLRLRICEGKHDCSSPAGLSLSGEVEDHRIRIGGCGDGIIDSWEVCDDGNSMGGDGCSASCEVERGFACSGEPSVCEIVEAPTIDTPTNGETPDGPWTPTVSGSCVPGMTVTVTEGSNEVCTATCSDEGTYACTGSEYGPGDYVFVVDQGTGGHKSPPSPPSNVTVKHPDDHCWVDGMLVKDGELEPTSNGCRVCITGTTNEAWSNVPDGTACVDDGHLWTKDVCEGGVCTHKPTGECEINGGTVPNGAGNPENDCEWCDSSVSPTQWTARPANASCLDDGLGWTRDTCDGAGNCTHVPTGQCWIEGALVEAGAENPANECLWCNPTASASGWSAKAKGTACADDGLSCTSDVCDGAGQCDHPVSEGCLIEGVCVADRESQPGKDCYECNARYATDGYSPKPDGENCETNGMCDGGGTCWPRPAGNCTIAGVEYANGAVNPANECEHCDSFVNPEGWANKARGAACGDDGLSCTSSACDGAGSCSTKVLVGCLIEGACVTDGANDPSNDCMECNPAKSQTSYVSKTAGSVCEDDGNPSTQDLCDGAGTCEHTEGRGYCVIDGAVLDAGSVDPANECQWCDPLEDSSGWSNRPNGTACTSDELSCTNDVCEAGGCGHVLFGACLIEGRCIGVGGVPAGEDCRECSLALPGDYSPKAPGEACSSLDGEPTMLNVCGDDGNCTHRVRESCIIDGKSWPEGVSNPENVCEWCSPAVSLVGWSPKAEGNPCAADAMDCTTDGCDGAGNCKHDVMSGYCAIDGMCMGPNAQSPNDPCLVCDPARSTTDYVLSGAKECISCTTDDDCDDGYQCVHGECAPKPRPECVVDGDCDDGYHCVDSQCEPKEKEPACVDDSGCEDGYECKDGVCVQVPQPECVRDDDCGDGKKCEDGRCVLVVQPPCIDDAECGDGEKCVDGSCVAVGTPPCETNSECGEGEVCLRGECQRVSLEGGGFDCSVRGAHRESTRWSGTAGLLGALGVFVSWVRRRNAR